MKGCVQKILVILLVKFAKIANVTAHRCVGGSLLCDGVGGWCVVPGIPLGHFAG